ncbi:hypothetical protein V8E51_019845 [Hyaloscypha variabilis]
MTRIKSLLFTLPQLDIPPQPKVLHSFTIFPKLAPEIRAMIWKHAAFESRTIKLFRLDGRSDPAKTSVVEGQQRHPGIVHASRNSRAVALKVYTKCQENPRQELTRQSIMGMGNVVFVNFSTDRFLFVVPPNSWLGYNIFEFNTLSDFNFMQPIVRDIKHLEINIHPENENATRLEKYSQLIHMMAVQKIAPLLSIRFTFIDFFSSAETALAITAKNCLMKNRMYKSYAETGAFMSKYGLPALEFHWYSTGDTGSWPCAPVEQSSAVVD